MLLFWKSETSRYQSFNHQSPNYNQLFHSSIAFLTLEILLVMLASLSSAAADLEAAGSFHTYWLVTGFPFPTPKHHLCISCQLALRKCLQSHHVLNPQVHIRAFCKTKPQFCPWLLNHELLPVSNWEGPSSEQRETRTFSFIPSIRPQADHKEVKRRHKHVTCLETIFYLNFLPVTIIST